MANENNAPAWGRLKSILQAALEEPPDSREEFLDRACAGDDRLRREVESLLAAHDEAGGFLSRPAAELGFPVAEGRRIGPYRVLNEIGRGGMAVVYRAVRDDDLFQKTVALKLLSGVGSEVLLRRFFQERQILGRLQHPNIAAVFDGGATEEGQPYLVMELVDGRPITEYCDSLRIGTKRRLEMFRFVCEAVHYAHQNLVIHRDLKPGNILVDANGTPKLLDFGIAKLLSAGEGGEAPPTQTLAPMMTPEYASPEQIKGDPITTSTDVYSLGVLLYELLTGEHPYPVKAESLDEIVRNVCDTDPVPPSTAARKRLSTLEGDRGPRAAASELRGDLDTIVLKALRKEPERRYVSAHELAEDLRRYLERRPVAARRDTFGYRFTKLVARNRGAAVAAGLILLSLLGGLIVSLQQARIARAERARAESRFDDVRQLANSLLFELHDEIAELPGSTPARELLVNRAATYLDRLSQESESDPGLQRELADAYQRLGDVQGNPSGANLGDIQGALGSYEKAIRLRRALTTPARDPSDLERLAFLLSQMGRFFSGTGEWDRAEESAREAIALLEECRSSGAFDAPDLRGRLAVSRHTLGYVLLRKADAKGALAALELAARDARDFAAAHPESSEARARLANIETDFSESLRLDGRLEESAAVSHEARVILSELLEAEPRNPMHTRGVIVALSYEADALEALGKYREAVEIRDRAVGVSRGFLASDEKNAGALLGVVITTRRLGGALFLAGDAPGALGRLRESVEVGERALAASSGAAWASTELAGAYAQWAEVLNGSGAPAAETCVPLGKALALWDRMKAEGRLPADVGPDYERLRNLPVHCPPG